MCKVFTLAFAKTCTGKHMFTLSILIDCDKARIECFKLHKGTRFLFDQMLLCVVDSFKNLLFALLICCCCFCRDTLFKLHEE